VQKLTRVAFLFGGAILALLATALLAVNLYVQSQGTQARIEQELSQRLGATLHIRRISVTPWFGLKLTGITMPQADPTTAGDFLRADTFRLRVRLASLFSRRLVITEISLINPKVIWAQDTDGKWRLPASFPEESEPAVAATGPARVGVVSPAPVASPPPVVAAQPGPAAEAEAANFTPEVRRVYLKNGSFRFLDAKQEPVATFEGVRFRSNFRSATELRGTASIAKTSLRDRFFLEDLKSPLTYDPSELDFSAITAEAADGEITGRFNMRPGDAGSPFTVMVKFHDLEADRLLSDAHGPEGMVLGKLEGHLDATGKTADVNALSGTGEIYLRQGQVHQYSLLVALGQLLQIDEMAQMRLNQAHVKFHIDPGVVTVDDVVLASSNLRLSATGTISFAGKLQLEAQLAINERIRRRLFSALRANFQPTTTPGYTAVSFQISGTLDRPRSNLMDKLVGRELRDLGGVIDSLLGRGRKRAKEKPPTEETAPTAPPAMPSAPPLPSTNPPPPTPAGIPVPSASVPSPAPIVPSPAPSGSP
jgi:uncharacterized protein involved in outer membrane biogenesis